MISLRLGCVQSKVALTITLYTDYGHKGLRKHITNRHGVAGAVP